MIHQLSSANGNTICPKMIVVGILNTNRSRDLTPTKGTPGHPSVDSTLLANSGGGDNFISFIEKELFPYIDSNYPTENYKLFVGHSFGGLTVMNTLTQHPELFNSYIAIDPSMWWSDKTLLKEIESTFFDDRYNNKSLFLGIANTMRDGMNTISVKKDTTTYTEHIRSILELNSILLSKSGKKLAYQDKYYEKDDHGSISLIAEYDALRFIFDFYRLKLVTQDYLDPEVDIIGKITKHYKKLSTEFGRELKPDQAYINSIGYGYLKRNFFVKAESFYKLNTINYPESSKVYESLGDYYSKIGNKEKAFENYKKSISINNDSDSKKKLFELEIK